MKAKLNSGDIFAAALLILIYVPMIVYFLLGQKSNFFVSLWENYILGKVLVLANPISAGIFWFWMLFDWGTRTFVKKKYKVYWLIIFFLTYTFGSTIYYFLVRKFRKGLSPK